MEVFKCGEVSHANSRNASTENGWHSVNFCKGFHVGPNCLIIVSSSGRMSDRCLEDSR